MCMSKTKDLLQESIIGYKVMEKVPDGYCCIFTNARRTDNRVFKLNEQYLCRKYGINFGIFDDYMAGFSAFVQKEDAQEIIETIHEYLVVTDSNLVIVKVELSGSLVMEIHDKADWKNKHIGGLNMKILEECPMMVREYV